MRSGRVVTTAGYLTIAAVLAASAAALRAQALDEQLTPAIQHHTAPQNAEVNDLIKTVRLATERFRDVSAAEAEGYGLLFGCVSGPDSGAMGLHYVNLALVGDGELDPTRPEIVIYEPAPDGRPRLVGADFLVFADAWHAKNAATPELGGQLLHRFDSPNRFGLPAFYTLHVWAWKDNPNGAFVNWHPKISCDGFSAKNP